METPLFMFFAHGNPKLYTETQIGEILHSIYSAKTEKAGKEFMKHSRVGDVWNIPTSAVVIVHVSPGSVLLEPRPEEHHPVFPSWHDDHE